MKRVGARAMTAGGMGGMGLGLLMLVAMAGSGTSGGLVNGLRLALGIGAVAELSGVAVALRFLTTKSAEQNHA